jgi:transcriptional regulator
MPEAFAVTEEAERADLLERLAFGCLVTHGPDGLFASHLPFVYDAKRKVLAGHLARANPHQSRAGEAEALVIFQGANAYVSPSWYPSKVKHGRVVPTWNYEVVHVRGRLSWREDPAWLRGHLNALTDRFEASRAKPWAVADAPEDYLERMIGGIVGLEIATEDIQAKRKLSQNRDDPDRFGVIAGLSASDSATDRDVATAMDNESGMDLKR